MEFPKSTEFNKRIPKQKFYDKLSITPDLKEAFKSIASIRWMNKLSQETINLDAGQDVTEIQVFEIKLNNKTVEETVLRQIDKQIPYHILFIVEYEGEYQAWISYKEAGNGKNAFQVDQYYHTEWLSKEELPIKIEGLNLDSVYESFVRQTEGNQLVGKSEEKKENLKQIIERTNKVNKLEKQISKLEARIKKEKQLNKKIEQNSELRIIKRELEEIKNGKNEDGIH